MQREGNCCPWWFFQVVLSLRSSDLCKHPPIDVEEATSGSFFMG